MDQGWPAHAQEQARTSCGPIHGGIDTPTPKHALFPLINGLVRNADWCILARPMDLAVFIDTWRNNSGGEERANKDKFLIELCAVLGIPGPNVKTGDRKRDHYVFEADVLTMHEGGKTTTLKADLYKHGCFILEAKQGSEPGAPKTGGGRRGTPQWHQMMQDALGQAIGYARSMDEPPPFIITCDIGYVFELYEDFQHTGYYRPFPNAQRNRLFVSDLAQHAPTLRALFLDPRSLDPSLATIKVTRQVAEKLADIAKHLEKDGHDPEAVAKFLMRCLFTMFAEDVDLLPDKLFSKAIEEYWLPAPSKFHVGIEILWKAMNDGSPFGFTGQLLRFNGGLFADPSALPLQKEGLELLLEAARCDWSDVEPAIFGTLLERALNPKERHALGAHFTPRAYVERLVRPTIEEPLRTEWENVQAIVHKLNADGKLDAAKEAVHVFHQKLCQTRVLDPACGSGNFLYVTLNVFKQIESEVLALLASLGEKQEQLLRVTPKQFLGIEVKPWAKEIAELVLWIGYLQWHYRTHGKRVPPPEPVLQDFQNIERRDAILAWDSIDLVRDERGKPVTRWDGETYKRSSVTGEQVPDKKAQVVIEKYINPRKAEWPRADFIVGNPPFIGGWRMRQVLGDGYVEALWSAFPHIPEKCDYVMYWWDQAAEKVRAGKVRQFGLITTNSITQIFQRRVIQRHIEAKEKPLRLIFAIPDHPWVDSADAADVRVAMTTGTNDLEVPCALGNVLAESEGAGADKVLVHFATAEMINADLTVGVNLDHAKPLHANSMLCSPGVQLYGSGFILDQKEAAALAKNASSDAGRHIVRSYMNGKDLMGRSRNVFVIDFFGLDEDGASRIHPAAFQRVLDRVKPERDQNRRESIRTKWWRFGWERPIFRHASRQLRRFIATPETAKHRVMVFLDEHTLPDNMLTNFAIDDAYYLGVLSSRIHVVWALATGGRLGVGNDPRYTKTRCFDPFPFPACSPAQEQRIRDLGEQLDAHRKSRQAAHPDLTLTGMYNVLEKLRAGAELGDKERDIHTKGLISILKKLHDEIDAAVFEAYGWPADLSDEQILEKLVALNAERAEEEKKGLIRWLRPDFQNPGGKKPEVQQPLLAVEEESEEEVPPSQIKPWPKKIADQLAAVRDRVSAPGKIFSISSVVAAFKGAKKKDVEGLLDALAALGLLTVFETTAGKRWRAVGKTA